MGMSTVLVVDDTLTSLQHIVSLLDGLYEVMPAKSGEQAVKMTATRRPDLVLLDVNMPGMDGFATLKMLRADDRLGFLPVIFLTAIHDTELEIKALQAGANDFLTKPVEKSVLVHRIDLHLRLSGYQQELRKTVRELENSIAVNFAELIECRDANTGGHVLRTSKYFALFGEELIKRGFFPDLLDAQTLDMMVQASPLHDIGKIGISDTVLLKPGRLDEKEFAIIKKHPEIGATILGSMFNHIPTQQHLYYARNIAEYHHERYDGKGYPQGLAGEDIPLCARIMAIVDVYDALVSQRVYRHAMSHEEALRIILDGRGTNFDPVMIDVFAEIHESFRSHAKDSSDCTGAAQEKEVS